MATPVFFLPGLLEDSDLFEPQIARLRESRKCVVADLTRSDSMAGMARDALAQAPGERFALVGHSMGGYLAFEILRQAPERVERLALLNTHARPDTPEATENRRRLMKLAQTDFPAVAQTLLPKMLSEKGLADPLKSGTVTEMALGVGREAFVRQENAIISRPDSRPLLGTIKCPTLVVAGRHDALIPYEFIQELAHGIPGARFVVIEGSGHVTTIERPAEVADLLESFLG